MLWYLSGWSEDYSDILVLYVGAGHFWGVQNFKFQYFLWFSRKENESFLGGGYEEIVDIFWGQLQIGLFWGSFLYILGLFLRPRYIMGMFLGDHKISRFSFFFGGGGGGMPDIPIFRVGVNSGCIKKN